MGGPAVPGTCNRRTITFQLNLYCYIMRRPKVLYPLAERLGWGLPTLLLGQVGDFISRGQLIRARLAYLKVECKRKLKNKKKIKKKDEGRLLLSA